MFFGLSPGGDLAIAVSDRDLAPEQAQCPKPLRTFGRDPPPRPSLRRRADLVTARSHDLFGDQHPIRVLLHPTRLGTRGLHEPDPSPEGRLCVGHSSPHVDVGVEGFRPFVVAVSVPVPRRHSVLLFRSGSNLSLTRQSTARTGLVPSSNNEIRCPRTPGSPGC